MKSDLKIGIITFHNAANYGAMLQCYALKQSLLQLGFEATQVIDYRNILIERAYCPDWKYCLKNVSLSLKGIKQTAVRIIYTFLVKKRLRSFHKFKNNYLRPSKAAFNTYDIIIFGSDQIWNTGITHDDDTFFGDIGTDKVRKISYAASLGHGNIEVFKSKITLLSQFESIGVREPALATIIGELGLSAYPCLDPTLLLRGEQWCELLGLSNATKSQEPFLLAYCIRNKERTIKAAINIAEQKGLKLIVLDANDTLSISSLLEKSAFDGPREFVKKFSEAECVVTDSFHGTVFSILFHKPFLSMRLDDGRDNRAGGLLSQLNLLSQFVRPNEVRNSLFEQMSFDECDCSLERKRKNSLCFLTNSILL